MSPVLKTFAPLAMVTICLHAQAFGDLTAPQPRHIAGIVVDQDGKPVDQARIDYARGVLSPLQTDSSGRFEFNGTTPILVFRKPGFRSELLRTQDTAADVRLTLQKLNESGVFPTCSAANTYVGVDPERGFQFGKVAGVKASRFGHDVDYVMRNYYIKTRSRPNWIMHGIGFNWTSGMPSDIDIARSINYQERTYDFGGVMIIDARGQFPDGSYWRYLGKFGESASYSAVDQATAKILDKFLDGACLTP